MRSFKDFIIPFFFATAADIGVVLICARYGVYLGPVASFLMGMLIMFIAISIYESVKRK